MDPFPLSNGRGSGEGPAPSATTLIRRAKVRPERTGVLPDALWPATFSRREKGAHYGASAVSTSSTQ
jgi:hypothetical protein